MTDMSRSLGLGLCALALATMMSACHGSSSNASVTPPPTSGPPPVDDPPLVSGIATPSSVSVVTATNSN